MAGERPGIHSAFTCFKNSVMLTNVYRRLYLMLANIYRRLFDVY
jgi:hypothetical protein